MSKDVPKDFEDPIQSSQPTRRFSSRSRRALLRGELRNSKAPVISSPIELLPTRSPQTALPEESRATSSTELARIDRKRFLEYGIWAATILIPAGLGTYVVWNRNGPPLQAATSFSSPSEKPTSEEQTIDKEVDPDTKRIVNHTAAAFVNPGIERYQYNASYLWEVKQAPPSSSPNGAFILTPPERTKPFVSFTEFYDYIYPEDDPYRNDVIKALWKDDPTLMAKAMREALKITQVGRTRVSIDSRLYLMRSYFWESFLNSRNTNGYNADTSPEAFRKGSLSDPFSTYSRDGYARHMGSRHGEMQNRNRYVDFPYGQRFSLNNLIRVLVAEAVSPQLEMTHTQNRHHPGVVDQESTEILKELAQKMGNRNFDLLIFDLSQRFRADIRKMNVGIAVLNPADPDEIVSHQSDIFKGLKIDSQTISEWHRSRGL